MVGFAPGGGDVAALGAAVAVADAHGLALGGVVEPLGAAEVEDLGLPAEDGGDEVGGARQAAGLGGADALAGAGGRDPETGEQGLEVHR